MAGNRTHVNCLEGSYNLLNWLKSPDTGKVQIAVHFLCLQILVEAAWLIDMLPYLYRNRDLMFYQNWLGKLFNDKSYLRNFLGTHDYNFKISSWVLCCINVRRSGQATVLYKFAEILLNCWVKWTDVSFVKFLHVLCKCIFCSSSTVCTTIPAGDAGDWTRGLIHAKHALYNWAISPECFKIFLTFFWDPWIKEETWVKTCNVNVVYGFQTRKCNCAGRKSNLGNMLALPCHQS